MTAHKHHNSHHDNAGKLIAWLCAGAVLIVIIGGAACWGGRIGEETERQRSDRVLAQLRDHYRGETEKLSKKVAAETAKANTEHAISVEQAQRAEQLAERLGAAVERSEQEIARTERAELALAAVLADADTQHKRADAWKFYAGLWVDFGHAMQGYVKELFVWFGSRA